MKIDILYNVELMQLNEPMLKACQVVSSVCEKQGVRAVMTGASGESYPEKGYHAKNYALDFRCKHLPNQGIAFADIYMKLHLIDILYRVLWHDTGNGIHFHVEYRYDDKPFPEGYPEIK